MNQNSFYHLLESQQNPVILLEGTRDLSAEKAGTLTQFATDVARRLPHARFRTGNAKGSDEAFAKGIIAVDVTRLEYVLPYTGHRKKDRPEVCESKALSEISALRVNEVVNATIASSPKYERLAVNYRDGKIAPRQKAVAQLLLRDTLKVTGTDDMPPPCVGIFYVNAADPDSGGTGHTIRVCRVQGIPVITQFEWMGWNCE